MELVLVDHNNVVAEIEHLKDSIVRVIDHHRIFTNFCLQSEPLEVQSHAFHTVKEKDNDYLLDHAGIHGPKPVGPVPRQSCWSVDP